MQKSTGLHLFRWPMYLVIWVVVFQGNKASPPWQSEQTRDNHPILFQCWASVEDCGSILKQHRVNTLCLLMWRKVYKRSSVGLVFAQRRKQLTDTEPAMGCDAGPTMIR